VASSCFDPKVAPSPACLGRLVAAAALVVNVCYRCADRDFVDSTVDRVGVEALAEGLPFREFRGIGGDSSIREELLPVALDLAKDARDARAVEVRHWLATAASRPTQSADEPHRARAHQLLRLLQQPHVAKLLDRYAKPVPG